jgi:hypothetical protein
MELGDIQEDIYNTEKEIERVKEGLAELESKLTILQLREVSLQEKAQQPVARLGGLLVTAVWDSREDISGAGDDGGGEREESDQIRSSTQELGHSAPPVEFSQTLSDIPDKRIKVTRKEAHGMKNIKEEAEVLVKKVLDIKEVDLTSEDLEEFERCVKNVRMRMKRMAMETGKKKKGLERPDETFLSSSAFAELKKKVDAKKQGLDSSEESAEDEMEEAVEVEAVAGRGFYKAFKDLVPHSKDMKRRAAPLLSSVRDWCETNFCDIESAIGYMLHAVCYSSDKVVAALGWRLFIHGKDAIMTGEVPPLVALWLVERLRLGRGRYTDTRLLMLRYRWTDPRTDLDKLDRVLQVRQAPRLPAPGGPADPALPHHPDLPDRRHGDRAARRVHRPLRGTGAAAQGGARRVGDCQLVGALLGRPRQLPEPGRACPRLRRRAR